MSHKTTLAVNINDRESLVAALEEMGYEVSQEKKTLRAFSWQINADITIKKDGRTLNIGFIEQEDGTFRLEADFWGTGIAQRTFQNQLNMLHGKHKVTKWFNENRYQTSLETDEEGNLVVVGTKWN